MKKIILRDFEDNDIKLMEEWLKQDYVLKWYHEPDDWIYEIKERHNDFSWLHHFIVMADNEPIGFCQYYDCFNANGLEAWYKVEEAHKTFSIDYLIGEKDYLGKGYGKEIVAILIDRIKYHENGYEIIVQPERDNHASNGVLLANGYMYDEKKQYYFKIL